jgi:hypothetical protein
MYLTLALRIALFLIAGSLSSAMNVPPEATAYRMDWFTDKVAFYRYNPKAVKQYPGGKWVNLQSYSEIHTYQSMFQNVFLKGWCKEFNLVEFNLMSLKWHPDPNSPMSQKPDPNDIPVVTDPNDADGQKMLESFMWALRNNIPLDSDVWVTPSGDKFHKKECRYAKTASAMTLKDAILAYKQHCSVCWKEEE